MTLMPGEVGSGIIFKRTDAVTGRSMVPATWDHVVGTTLCTTIGNPDGVKVGTVEHLMSAFAGCAIDNALIEIDGPEVPIMDGSAAPFVSLIESAEVVEQSLPRRVIRILHPVSVEDGNRRVSLVPGVGFSLSFEIDFSNPAVSRQTISIGLGNGTFKKELAGARTFGFLHEVETLRAAGLARGGSLDNAVVISGDKILNEDGLRYTDEFVRHKVLDAMGDLYLAGAPIIGAFSGVCSGHAANNRLLHALFADRDAWTYETLTCGDHRGGVWADDLNPLAVATA